MNGPNKLEHYITFGLKGFPAKKRSSLFGVFVSSEENEVLWIQCQLIWPIRKIHRKMFYNIGPWGLYYKTFYSRILWIFVIATAFVPGKPFRPSLMFMGKARGLP